jgi:hypothetical protein
MSDAGRLPADTDMDDDAGPSRARYLVAARSDKDFVRWGTFLGR